MPEDRAGTTVKFTGIATLTVTTPSEREIRLTRIFDAPRARVFEAWTKPELMKRWFAPRGWTLATCESEMKAGGALRMVWQGPRGESMGLRGIYREVAPPVRIVHTEVFDDPWYPGEAVATTEFEERGRLTTMTMTILYASQQIRDEVLQSGMDRGVGQTCDRLAEFLAAGYDRLEEGLPSLARGAAGMDPDTVSVEPGRSPMKRTGRLQIEAPGDREIVMTRVFRAPRRLVFDAHTKCDLLKRWLFGPDGWSLAVCETDLRPGGKYRYVWRHPQKKEMGMGGVIREVVPPERLVTTEKFDDAWYPGEAVNTMLLTEKDGVTTMTLTLLYESRQAREVALQSGMETGMEMGYARLDVIFASTAAK